ncbi:hypothetical protein HPB48_014140 [Haemaphysalis longicornis]|uniref:Uncharacterized protein n=1 Tax=Haemaphysalis longicornis TaxID=44386 RepID=A0A9J6FA05_HAELO|nr:hypothetical protein HPB48_014140 [Haemaphysalis longicornis]
MLPAVTRKTTARRAKEEDGGDPSSSSGGRSDSRHGHAGGARAVYNRAHRISSRRKPTAAKRAQDRQLRDAHPARLDRPPSRPTGIGLKAAATPSKMKGSDNSGTCCDSMPSCPRETTSDEEDVYSLYYAVKEALARDATNDPAAGDTDTSDDEDVYSSYYAVKEALAKESARSSSQLR